MLRPDMLQVMGSGAAVALFAPKMAFAQRGDATLGGRNFLRTIDSIETRSGGRLGVAVLDMASGRGASHRGGERFAMCSTFKFPLSAAVLHAAERRRLRLDQPVAVTRRDMIANSPVTARRVGGTMTPLELCHATMTTSDNTAANLLLPLIGGADGFNAFVRMVGDGSTRLDRPEPHLGEATPGDPRDTTTPDAMLLAMRAILFGSTLSPASRKRLTGWLVANTTGGARLRAGLPKGWRVGDKTGTGANGTANDIGLFWPREGRPPVLVTSYLTGATGDQRAQYAAHADVARAIVSALRQDQLR